MDQQWRRFHLLFVLLTLWKLAIGYPGLNSQLNPRSLRYHEALSPRGFKSSSAALMTKNIPLDVHSNVAASATYKSVSQTQSSPTGSVSASLVLPQNLQGLDGLSTPLQLHGSSSSNVKGMAGQSAGGPGSNSQYDFTYKYRTGPQAGGQLVSAQGGSGFSQAFPENSAPSVLGQSSNVRLSSSSSQRGSDLQLGGMARQLHSQGSGAAQFLGASSQHAPGSPAHAKLLSSSGRFPSQVTDRQGSPSWYTSTSQDSSRSKLPASSSQLVSAQGGSATLSGLSSQSRSTSSPYSPVSVFGPSSEKASRFSLGSGSRGGSSHFGVSHLSGPSQGVSSNPVGLYVPSQGSPGQLAFGSPQYASVSTSSQYNQGSAKSLYSTASLASPQAVSGQYRQTTDGAFSSIQSSRLQPSVSSSSQGSQSSGAAWSQSRFSVPSVSAPSESLASSGRLSQSASASMYSSASMPSPQSSSSRYSQATGSALSLSKIQAPQRWQPSASLSSQGYQTSSTPVSQSSSQSQGAKFPSRFSLASGSGPSQLVSMQGASHSGLAQSSSSSAQYAPAYSKPASSPLGVNSQFTRGQNLYASSSQSMAGGTLGSSIRHASAHIKVGSNSASLQPQVAAGQYAPRPSLDVKVPVYRHDTSSGSSMSSRLQSQTWQPTTSRRVYSSFPTSGTAETQTSVSPQRVQSSSRLSSVAGGTSRLFTQSRGSYTGSSQSLGSVGPYTPGSSAYTKFGASSLGVSSQSTTGQSSSSQYPPLSTTGAGGELTNSSGFLSAQGEGGSVGSSLQSRDALAPMDISISASQTAAVSSGIEGSSASSSLSTLQALGTPVDSVPQSTSASTEGGSVGSSLQSQGAFGKDALAPMDTTMPVATQTAAVSSGIQVSGSAFQTGYYGFKG